MSDRKITFHLLKRRANMNNFESVKDALAFIRGAEFKNMLIHHPQTDVILMKINNKLKDVEKLKSNEFEGKEKLLIVFQSSTHEQQVVVNYKNPGSKDFYMLDFEEKFSSKLANFVLEFFINLFENGIYYQIPSIKGIISIFVTLLCDLGGKNLLMKATEDNNEELFNELLNYNFELHEKTKLDDGTEVTVADLAWKNKNQNILLKLLQNNSPFPTKFDENEVTDEILKIFIDDMNEIHSVIAVDKSESKINEILEKYPKLAYFYNPQNKSVPTSAIEAQNKAIYKFLTEKGCRIGKTEDQNEILKKIREVIKVSPTGDMSDADVSEFQEESHINYHLINSEAYRSENGQIIEISREFVNQKKKLFEIVNESEDGKEILKITAAGNKVKTHIDFGSENVGAVVRFVHPNSAFNVSAGTLGLFVFSTVTIFVGALNYENLKYQISGTLKHEHTHLALLLVFANDAKPYGIDDDENKERFEEFVEECQKVPLKGVEPRIIDSVFQHYEENVWHAELAVRAAQIETHYGNKENLNDQRKLDELKEEIFRDLFDYHFDVVMNALKITLGTIKLLSDTSENITYDDLTPALQSSVNYFINNRLVETRSTESLTSDEIRFILNNLYGHQMSDWYKSYQQMIEM